MRHLATSLFLIQLSTTLGMTGLIWFVQIVHYPLFARVGDAAFVPYARRHATLTGYVVGGPMLLELLSALATLVPSLRPPFISTIDSIGSVTLLAIIWAATGLLQVPLHSQLAHARDAALIDQLVRGNWIRTVAWSLRSFLLLFCLHRTL